MPINYPIINVIAGGTRGGGQSNDAKLEVLGRFAAAGNIRSMLGTKLLVNQQTGDLTIQDSGFKTWWARSAADSLTNPAVHRHVMDVFTNARQERNTLTTQSICLKKIQDIQYAFKGYSSLVRLGYSGEKILKKQVKAIAGIVCDLAPVPYVHKLSQGILLPEGQEGVCWAFVLDWLRRGFKGKDNYAGAKMAKKMDAIIALQEDQSSKVYASRLGETFGHSAPMRLVDVTRQSAYQGGYVTRQGHDAQRFNDRFDGMMYHIDRWFPIEPQDQRCYHVRGPGTAVPPSMGTAVINYLKKDRIASLLSESQSGWILCLDFRNYFNDAATNGHAVGVRLAARRTMQFFDPNYGTGEMPLDTGHLWIDSVIQNYSFSHAVENISVRRVSTMSERDY